MNHTPILYGLAAVALGVAVHADLKTLPTRTVAVVSAPAASRPVARTAWPALGQDKTIQMGEALMGAPKLGKVTIYCASVDCDALMHDFDDALQIAGWEADFERRPVDSQAEVGLFIGPAGGDAAELAVAVFLATGVEPTLVEMPELGIIIGKRPK